MGKELAPHYDTAFFEHHADGSRRSAAAVIPLVNALVKPASILDVGCGVGTWLSEWASRGVTDLLGLDGDYVDRAALQIPLTSFRAMDLQRPSSLERKFDLVESLEVAEHLDESYADTFVRFLTSHADTVLFSAAIPGQGGTHHVNEQWPSYWAEKFSHAGMMVFDVIRPAIWIDRRVEKWYRQNMLIFSRKADFEVHDTCIDIVHPDCWEALRNTEPSLRQRVKALPGAVISAVHGRALAQKASPNSRLVGH